MKTLERLNERGVVDLITMHFSTLFRDKEGKQVLDFVVGGYFDCKAIPGRKNWYSSIKGLFLRYKKRIFGRNIRFTKWRGTIFFKENLLQYKV